MIVVNSITVYKGIRRDVLHAFSEPRSRYPSSSIVNSREFVEFSGLSNFRRKGGGKKNEKRVADLDVRD